MDNKLKNMEEEYTVDNLEKLLIEKSCKIGFLENEIREKSFEISTNLGRHVDSQKAPKITPKCIQNCIEFSMMC